MDPPTFLKNERRVLRAAYEFAGYDVESHISAEFCLVQSVTKTEPLRIPICAQKPYAPPAALNFGNIPAIVDNESESVCLGHTARKHRICVPRMVQNQIFVFSYLGISLDHFWYQSTFTKEIDAKSFL